MAILVDASLARAILVPATMQLMGRWNWWFSGVGKARQKALRLEVRVRLKRLDGRALLMPAMDESSTTAGLSLEKQTIPPMKSRGEAQELSPTLRHVPPPD